MGQAGSSRRTTMPYPHSAQWNSPSAGLPATKNDGSPSPPDGPRSRLLGSTCTTGQTP